MVHRILGVVYILVNYKRRATRILIFVAQSYLIHRSVFPKDGVQLFRGYIERQIADVQDAIHFGREFGLVFRGDGARETRQ